MSPVIWWLENSVNKWNLVGLSDRLIIKPKNIYTSTFSNTLTLKMAKNYEISVNFGET